MENNVYDIFKAFASFGVNAEELTTKFNDLAY